MTRTDILNQIIRKCNYTSYLEIGVQSGVNFRRIQCRSKQGADPNPIYLNNQIHAMTSNEFFEKFQCTKRHRFDLIFIDGLHHAEQVERDFINSLRHLQVRGTIVLHDCNPASEGHQIVPRQQKEWNGDVWKAWVKINHTLGGFCIDSDHGVGIYSQHPALRQRTNQTTTPIKSVMEYADINTYPGGRKALFNLITIEQWKQILTD